jgi:polyisoprenoid-binding protein YceI
MRPAPFRHVACLLAAVALSVPAAHAENRKIDLERSTLTIFVSKSGLFSAFADNHTIRAPLAGGTLSDEAPLAVEITIRSANLKVLDPDLAASKRDEVQMRMLGPDVLDVDRYPDITFASTSIERASTNRWTVAGRLTIHGQTRPVTVAVAQENGRYRGNVTIKQRDFGITPISIAGGAVKVKDELKIDFDIVPASR